MVYNVGFAGSRSVAGRADSRSAESARSVSGAVCAVNTSKLKLTARRHSMCFAVPVLCAIVY